MRIIVAAVLFTLIMITCSFNVSNLNAMDNKQQTLKTLLEECLDDSNSVAEHTKKQIDSLNLSQEELKSFHEKLRTSKPECKGLISFVKARIRHQLKLEVERLMFESDRLSYILRLDLL